MSIKSGPTSNDLKLHDNVKHRIFGIVTAEWNYAITGKLGEKCAETLLSFGIPEANIIRKIVPGSFELPLAGQFLAEYTQADAIICIGCLIKGETPHFHYISLSVADEIMKLGTKYNKPFVFGVLTVDTEEQAWERAGGHHGNKGEEAAITALKMLSLKEELLSAAGN